MARKLVSLAQYEMQAAANKGGAKEMYNNSGWSVGNNAARRTGQRAAAGSSGKRTGGASAGTAQSAGGTAQSQLLELYSAQQAPCGPPGARPMRARWPTSSGSISRT